MMNLTKLQLFAFLFHSVDFAMFLIKCESIESLMFHQKEQPQTKKSSAKTDVLIGIYV